MSAPTKKAESRSADGAAPVITYRQALHDALRAEMRRDESVILLGEEIGIFEGSYKITAGLLDEFGPERVRDTPIAEEGFVGAAIGAAMLGMRPVVEIMTINFSLLAIDQIVNHAAKIYGMFGGQTSVPMVIRTPGGGGQQLAATHSQNLEVWYAHVPGLKVLAPSTPADAKAMLIAVPLQHQGARPRGRARRRDRTGPDHRARNGSHRRGLFPVGGDRARCRAPVRR